MPSTISLGQTALYVANATGGSPPYTYTWVNTPPGCFSGPSGLNFELNCTPAATGSFSTTFVTVVDSGIPANSTDSNTVTLNVVPALSVSASASPSSIDQGQAVMFTATTTGGAPPLSYSWSGLPPGCPPPPNSANVNCGSVTAPGTYPVTVTVNDSSGETSHSTATVVVHSPPTVSLSASPNPVSVGATTTLTATVSGGTGVNTFGYTGLPPGCVSSNTSTLGCTPTGGGGVTYTVTVSVTDTARGTTSNTVNLVVVNGVAVSVSATPAHGTDVGHSATFNASAVGGSGGYTFSWAGLPSGCPGNTGPTLTCTPTVAGSFSVTATATDNTGHSGTSAALSFFVNNTPTVAAHPSPASGKPPLNVTFTAVVTAGTPPFSYTWLFGDGTRNITPSPSVAHTYAANGSYTAVVWANDSAGASAQNSTAVLVSLSGFVVSVLATHPVVDVGQWTNLSAPVNGSATPPYTYTWLNLPLGCASANVANLSCRPTATTGSPFLVTVTVNTTSGASATGNLSLTVNPMLGFASGALFRYPIGCATPRTIFVNGTGAGGTPQMNGSPYSYAWSFGDGSTATTFQKSHTYPADGSYVLRVNVTDGAGNTVSRSHSVTVPPGGCSSGSTGFGTAFPLAALAVALVLIALAAIVAGLLWLRRQRRRGPPPTRMTPGAPSRPLTPAYIPPTEGPPGYPPPSGPATPAPVEPTPPSEPTAEEIPPPIPYDPDRPL